jgi:hypothetical protein
MKATLARWAWWRNSAASDRVLAIGVFSGKLESGFPSKNATNAKMLERFLFPVSVKPLQISVRPQVDL